MGFSLYYNWRRHQIIRRILLWIHWDKFARLDLVISLHSASILTNAPSSSTPFCFKILCGGKEYWTKVTGDGTHMDETFDVVIIPNTALVCEISFLRNGKLPAKVCVLRPASVHLVFKEVSFVSNRKKRLQKARFEIISDADRLLLELVLLKVRSVAGPRYCRTLYIALGHLL